VSELEPFGADPVGVGPAVLDYLQRILGVDPEWSIRTARRLDWWPHTYRQTIIADEPFEDNGVALTAFTCRTEIVESLPESPSLYAALSGLNQFASLSCLVYDPNAKTVASASRVHIHPDSSWLAQFLQAAAGIQLHQVEQLGPAWETTFGGRFSRSPHPTSGLRKKPDDMVRVLESVFAPAGHAGSPFKGLMEAVDQMPHPWATLERTRDRLVAEVPFRDAISRSQRMAHGEPISTALLVVTTDEKHPDLGDGLVAALELPFPAKDGEAHRVANSLNLLETQGAVALQSLGAWCAREVLQYRLFVPALLAKGHDINWRTQLIHTLMLYMTHRAELAHQVFETSYKLTEADKGVESAGGLPKGAKTPLPVDPQSVAKTLGIPEEWGITAPISAYAQDLDRAMRSALEKLERAALGLDQGSFMLDLMALMLNATNERLKDSAVDDELRQAVMLKVVELSFIMVHGDPHGSNPELLKLKRWMYDQLQQRERRWADAWQSLLADKAMINQINPKHELGAFELYLGLMASLFALGIQGNPGSSDQKNLEAITEIAGDAIMSARPDKFATEIANGNRGTLLSYAHTRMGRFL